MTLGFREEETQYVRKTSGQVILSGFFLDSWNLEWQSGVLVNWGGGGEGEEVLMDRACQFSWCKYSCCS